MSNSVDKKDISRPDVVNILREHIRLCKIDGCPKFGLIFKKLAKEYGVQETRPVSDGWLEDLETYFIVSLVKDLLKERGHSPEKIEEFLAALRSEKEQD